VHEVVEQARRASVPASLCTSGRDERASQLSSAMPVFRAWPELQHECSSDFDGGDEPSGAVRSVCVHAGVSIVSATAVNEAVATQLIRNSRSNFDMIKYPCSGNVVGQRGLARGIAVSFDLHISAGPGFRVQFFLGDEEKRLCELRKEGTRKLCRRFLRKRSSVACPR
jgi:hypothetical protein